MLYIHQYKEYTKVRVNRVAYQHCPAMYMLFVTYGTPNPTEQGLELVTYTTNVFINGLM